MSLRKNIEWRILDVWSIIDEFIRVKLLRDCNQDCALCALDTIISWHYDRCKICQGADYPCSAMDWIHDNLQQDIIKEMFPDIDKI